MPAAPKTRPAPPKTPASTAAKPLAKPAAKSGAPAAAPPANGKPSAADTAKAALRRLALSKLEPTPENYARAWSEEGGAAPAALPVPEEAPAAP
ncbi:MAG TPA: hypothetical protein VF457_18320, partial [Burkholderiaceae bacterium]